MKRWMLVVAVVVLALAGGTWLALDNAFEPGVPAALDPVHASKAQAFVAALDRDDYAAAEAMMTPATRAEAEGLLKTVWTALPKQLGARRGVGAPRGELVGDKRIVAMRLDFESMALDARVGFAADGAIDGFRLVPAAAEPPPPPPADAPYEERELAVGALPHALGATLALPRGARERRVPGVVLVHGSGPLDRNETVGPNRPFLEIARGFAARGIAVLRYEKRLLAHPDRFAGAYTPDDETVDDALAAVEVLRGVDGVDPDRVYVLGHSLGALFAPRMLSRDPRLAGALLVAAPSGPLEDSVVRQVRYIAGADGTITNEELVAIATVGKERDAIAALDESSAATKPLLGFPPSYWSYLRSYDPVEALRRVPQRALVVHGGRDYQVDDAEFARWEAAFTGDPRVALKRYPELNHLLIAGTGPSTPQEYFLRGSVDARVIDDAAAWVLAGSGTPANRSSAASEL